jgi:glycosyltransferase involved in cell wall biosynthesis
VNRGFGPADTVYAFNGAALEIFQAAKAVGLRTILDQTAAPWRWNTTMLREERQRWPGWEILTGEVDELGLLTHREEAEWRLADIIITGSDFCKKALAQTGGPFERAVKLSYPLAQRQTEPRCFPAAFTQARKLRVLFLGTLQLRKGIQYLCQAAEALAHEPVEFRAAGPSNLSVEAHATVSKHIDAIGPVTRQAVGLHYAWADVLALPTISEGSANVCYEAVAAGLPLITTRNAGVDLISGDSGLLIEPRDATSLAEAIQSLLRQPDQLRYLSFRAQRRLNAGSPDDYAIQLGAAVSSRPHRTQVGILEPTIQVPFQ